MVVDLLVALLLVALTSLSTVILSGGLFLLLLVFIAPVSFTSALPTLIHLMITIAFLASKLFRPLLQKPVSLILLRFHESRKGVLTQLAVGVGVLAKLMQVGVKYLFAI